MMLATRASDAGDDSPAIQNSAVLNKNDTFFLLNRTSQCEQVMLVMTGDACDVMRIS